MIVYPAIDLKDGRCVRLLHGDFNAATVYANEPADQARFFAEAGALWLHVVDLNGALEGRSINTQAVQSILAAIPGVKIQLGGGIRNLNGIEHWLAAGVERVVLGTVALRDPALVGEACARFPGRIAAAIDTRDGQVATDGWTTQSQVRAIEVALQMERAGVGAIVYTDINRDGALQGLNLEATVDLAFTLRTPVIASGGVGSLDDIRQVKAEADKGVAGVIVGRALYDGRIDPVAALAVAREPTIPALPPLPAA